MSLINRLMADGEPIRPVLVASHPRSGTHLSMDLLRRQFAACKVLRSLFQIRFEPYVNLDDVLANNAADDDKDYSLLTRSRCPIVKTHRRPDFLGTSQFVRRVSEEREPLAGYFRNESYIIYVGRDVVKTLISLYHFYPEHDRPATFSEFIRDPRGDNGITRAGYWAQHVTEWHSAENVLCLDADEVIRDTRNCLKRIGEHIGQAPLYLEPMLPPKPASRIHRKLGYLLSRDPVSTAVLSFGNNVLSVQDVKSADLQFLRDEIQRCAPQLLSTSLVKSLR